MILETCNRLGDVRTSRATRVMVRDDHGNPIVVLLQVGPNHIHARFKGQPGWDDAIKLLGIEDTSVVDVVAAPAKLEV